jgi:hypothetical protein
VKTRIMNIILLLLNLAVLAGQIWPEHAPPFAGTVTIVFLATNLLYLIGSFPLGNGR